MPDPRPQLDLCGLHRVLQLHLGGGAGTPGVRVALVDRGRVYQQHQHGRAAEARRARGRLGRYPVLAEPPAAGRHRARRRLCCALPCVAGTPGGHGIPQPPELASPVRPDKDVPVHDPIRPGDDGFPAEHGQVLNSLT